MNKVILVGTLGKDPDGKQTQNSFVCRLSLATVDYSGKEKVTDWHNVVVWGKAAENCMKYLKKGKKVLIEGKSKTRSYEQNGVKKWVTEIVSQNVQFLSPKEEQSQNESFDFGDNDVPF